MSRYKNISQTAESISSPKQMCKFLSLLKDDLVSNVNDWENLTLEQYFEAMGAMIEDSCIRSESSEFEDRLNLEQLDANAWKSFALILLYSSGYE